MGDRPRNSPPVGRFVILAVLIATGILGLLNGPPDLRQRQSGLQLLVACAVILYGIGGLAGAFGFWRYRSWTPVALYLWGLGATAAGSIAPIAFGCDVPWYAPVASGLASLAIAAVVILYGRRWLGWAPSKEVS